VRLTTLVERKSRYIKIKRVIDRVASGHGKARTASTAIIDALDALQSCVKTVTYDNGSEFAEHLGSTAYFAEPHSPWQRGTNENSNGLIRQYIRKGSSMNDLTDEQIQVIEDKLNHRPRKTLGFKTPSEVFFASFNRRTS